jgi:tetratricopeptide (TPR) repeat protein
MRVDAIFGRVLPAQEAVAKAWLGPSEALTPAPLPLVRGREEGTMFPGTSPLAHEVGEGSGVRGVRGPASRLATASQARRGRWSAPSAVRRAGVPGMTASLPVRVVLLAVVSGLGAMSCARRMPLQEAASLSPEALYLQCDADLRQGRIDEARQCCRELLAGQPEDGESWLLCATADRRAGQPGEAQEKLKKALAADASEAVWEAYLGAVNDLRTQRRAAALHLEQTGSFARAAELLEQDLPRAPEEDCELGSLYLRAGELMRAEDRFESAASGPVQRPCALRGLGLVALARGRSEEALALSRRLQELGEPPLPLPRSEARPDPLDSLKKSDALTRAELALLLVRLGPSASRASVPAEAAPLDLGGHPLHDAAAEAIARGWMRPAEDGFFYPDRIVDRLELGATLAGLFPASGPASADVGPEWHRAFPEIESLWAFSPYKDLAGPLALLRPATGAEAVELLLGLNQRRATRAAASGASGPR